MYDRKHLFTDLSSDIAILCDIKTITESDGNKTLEELGVTSDKLNEIKKEISEIYGLYIRDLPLEFSFNQLVDLIIEHRPEPTNPELEQGLDPPEPIDPEPEQEPPMSSGDALAKLQKGTLHLIGRHVERASRELTHEKIMAEVIAIIEGVTKHHGILRLEDGRLSLCAIGISESSMLDLVTDNIEATFDIKLDSMNIEMTLQEIVDEVRRLIFN